MIKVKVSGDFNKTEKFLLKLKDKNFKTKLDSYGMEGVQLLSLATPKDTSLTAQSWYHNINITKNGFNITWYNKNTKDGVPIVILLQYGHATRGGTFVEGKDFINPALKPLFNKISEDIWKEVIS